MITEFVWLAILMALATYPSRALLLLLPGARKVPLPVQVYLRLVAPAVLASVAAVTVAVTVDAAHDPSFHFGPEWLAIALCAAVVAVRRSLLLGLIVASVFIASARALGLAALP
jgi:branched-subunit amino acid transport protein